jgi:glycine cleavage system regulatory protein
MTAMRSSAGWVNLLAKPVRFVETVSGLMSVSPQDLIGLRKEREIVKARILVCYWAGPELGMSMTEIGKRLNISVSTASVAVKKGRQIVGGEGLKTGGNFKYKTLKGVHFLRKESNMESVFITTIVGDDRPDIINALAKTTRSLGGEWIKSKVIRLDGQFSAIMKVTIDEAQKEKLNQTLEQEFSGLAFYHAPVREVQPENTNIIDLVLDCNDRPGLTKEITRALYDLNLRPENLEVSRVPIFQMGKTVYSAKMRVGIPDTLSKEELSDTLLKVCDSCRINFD